MNNINWDRLNKVGPRITKKDMEIISLYASKINPPNCFVDIGTWTGASSYVALQSVNPGVKVYTMDTFDRFMFKDTEIIFLEQHSLSVARNWDKPIGVLFIDGNHYKANEDFIAWNKFVIPNGFILFHDYHPQFKNIVETCNHISELTDEYEVLFSPELEDISIMNNQDKTVIFQIRKK